jgi:hypothetical protein
MNTFRGGQGRTQIFSIISISSSLSISRSKLCTIGFSLPLITYSHICIFSPNHWILTIIINPNITHSHDETSPMSVDFFSVFCTVLTNLLDSLQSLTPGHKMSMPTPSTPPSPIGFTKRPRNQQGQSLPRRSVHRSSLPAHEFLLKCSHMLFQVPQQTNGYDCGVYLLHFARIFFSNAVAYLTHIHVCLIHILYPLIHDCALFLVNPLTTPGQADLESIRHSQSQV